MSSNNCVTFVTKSFPLATSFSYWVLQSTNYVFTLLNIASTSVVTGNDWVPFKTLLKTSDWFVVSRLYLRPPSYAWDHRLKSPNLAKPCPRYHCWIIPQLIEIFPTCCSLHFSDFLFIFLSLKFLLKLLDIWKTQYLWSPQGIGKIVVTNILIPHWRQNIIPTSRWSFVTC